MLVTSWYAELPVFVPKHGRVVITRFSRRQRVPLGAAQRERRKIALRMAFYAIGCVSMPAPRYVAYFPRFAPFSAPSISLQPGGPWKDQWQSPASLSVHRACLRERGVFLHERIRLPAWKGPYRHAYPGERVRLFVSQACFYPPFGPMQQP
jgi:hypothetical protein